MTSAQRRALSEYPCEGRGVSVSGWWACVDQNSLCGKNAQARQTYYPAFSILTKSGCREIRSSLAVLRSQPCGLVSTMLHHDLACEVILRDKHYKIVASKQIVRLLQQTNACFRCVTVPPESLPEKIAKIPLAIDELIPAYPNKLANLS